MTTNRTDVVTTGDSVGFGVMQITESGLAKNDFILNLDGQVFLRGAVSAFDLVMYSYSEAEVFEGFDFILVNSVDAAGVGSVLELVA